MNIDQYATLAVSQSVPAPLARNCVSVVSQPLRPTSPALQALHDFQQQPAFAIPHVWTVEQAGQLLKGLAARYLLVENRAGDFQGLLCACDLLGPRLMVQMRLHQLLPDELQVRDLMIPCGRLPSVQYRDLQAARVGDVLRTLAVTGHGFLCVQDEAGTGNTKLRGLFCGRDIGERLETAWNPSLRARSFSELHASLLGRADTDA